MEPKDDKNRSASKRKIQTKHYGEVDPMFESPNIVAAKILGSCIIDLVEKIDACNSNMEALRKILEEKK